MIDEKRNNPQREQNKQTDASTGVIASRAERNQKRKTAVEEAFDTKKRIWVQIRLIPIWLRVLLVLLLLSTAAVVGAMIGYGYIGDGQPSDVLKKETWVHILDIINGKES